ncbi:MAG: imidazolonepropionase [Bacteroidales bacterium]
MKTVFINIKEIVQVEQEGRVELRRGVEMERVESIKDGYLIIEDDKIESFGLMSELESDIFDPIQNRQKGEILVIDAAGKMVLPAFCDSHTHLVYAGSRETEYIDKIRGLSYQEIAARGGGILNSAALLHNTSEEDLLAQTLERAWEIIGFGTGAVEIKSGYGLTTQDEIKMLRVAKRVGESTPLTVKTTFLGAHAVPLRYKERREEYVKEIVNEMIPAIAAEGLADYIDVFTEQGFFSVEDTDKIFTVGIKYGMRPKVHANQMSFSGGVQVGVKHNAISVDHLEFTGQEEFNLLKESNTMATLLPGSTLFLEMEYAPAREMINNNLAVAIATNYNPGSSPYGDMKFMMAIAALKMKLTPHELINATTINGAYAMGLSTTHGTIAKGKRANLMLTKPIPSLEFIPYAMTTPIVEKMFLGGKEVDFLNRRVID